MKITAATYAFCCIVLVVSGASATRSMLEIETSSSSKKSLERADPLVLFEGDQCTVYGEAIACPPAQPNPGCCSNDTAGGICGYFEAESVTLVQCIDNEAGFLYPSCCQYTSSATSECQIPDDDDATTCESEDDYPVDSCLPDGADEAFPKTDNEPCPDDSVFYCCKA